MLLLVACAGKDESAGPPSGPTTTPPPTSTVARPGLLASNWVGPEGGEVVVLAGEGVYAGAVLAFDAGAVSEELYIEILETWDLGGGTLPEPVLVVLADGVLPEHGVTITLPNETEAYGAKAEDLALYGYVAGAGDWVRIDTEVAKGDGVTGKLVGKLESVFAATVNAIAAGVAIISEGTNDAASAVVSDAKAVGTSVVVAGSNAVQSVKDLAVAVAAKSAAIIVKMSQPAMLAFQPALLKGPEGLTLSEWLCGGQPTVLFVHGIFSSPDAFQGADDVLPGLVGAQKWSVGTFRYPSGLAVSNNGKTLAALLDGARAGCTGEASVPDAVAHSMGGLVLRSAVQQHGAGGDLGRIVMLDTPNLGGDNTLLAQVLLPSQVELLVSVTLPGLSDLLFGSELLASLADPGGVALHASSYYAITGWAKSSGGQASDGWVEIKSALGLELPSSHEWYISALATTGKPAPTMHVNSDGFSAWEGSADPSLNHGGIHESAANNGVLPLIIQILTGTVGEPWCVPECAGHDCGAGGCPGVPDGCGTCSGLKQCTEGQCVCQNGGSGDACDPPCSDADGDGYLAGPGCPPPADCDDTRYKVHPGAEETCDGLDNDCDAATDEDACALPCTDMDGDGFGTGPGCPAPADCDDTKYKVHPGAEEKCDDIDNDCDDVIDEEACGEVPYENAADTDTTDVLLTVTQVEPSTASGIKLYAKVETQSGEPLAQLTMGNFELSETMNSQTAPVSLDSFQVTGATKAPANICLVIDSSGSMGDGSDPASPLAQAKVAAKLFVSKLKPEDLAAVIDFGDDVHVNTVFTNDKQVLFDAIDACADGGSTSMYDALLEAIDLTALQEGQRAIVLLSDGGDNDSACGTGCEPDVAIVPALDAGVPIFTIGLGTSAGDILEQQLIAIADGTFAGKYGSGYKTAPSASDLQQLYVDIATVLKSMYLLGWYTTGAPGELVQVLIEVTYTCAAGTVTDSFSTMYTVP